MAMATNTSLLVRSSSVRWLWHGELLLAAACRPFQLGQYPVLSSPVVHWQFEFTGEEK